MSGELASAYKSGSQRAGKVTEAWGAENFYCQNCSSPKLDWLKPGTKANDYRCPSCGFWYQLKSQKNRIAGSVTDGAYGAMMDAIKNDRSPNFFFLHYDLATWTIRNLLLVPHFAFPPSAIIKRKPLSAHARRAGWVGCNFDLTRIPAEARIWLVRSAPVPGATTPAIKPVHELRGSRFARHIAAGRSRTSASQSAWQRDGRAPIRFIATPADVRKQFQKIKPLADVAITQRDWTLDVLTFVRRLVDCRRRGDESQTEAAETSQSLLTSSPTNQFTNADIYAYAGELETLHPDNRHVRDKIRQQLQVLRDARLLIHAGRGVWRLP